MKSELIITIDGPAGSGKSTIGQKLARHIQGAFLGSGQLYRWLGWQKLTSPAQAQIWEADDFSFQVEGHQISFFFRGQAPSAELASPEVGEAASIIAVDKDVRQRLLAVQRNIDTRPLVAEGRDMGTVVFPEADYKFFLTASTTVRATRRAKQLNRLSPKDIARIATDIEARDARDRDRTHSPLKLAEDAISIDTDHLTIEDVVKAMLECIAV